MSVPFFHIPVYDSFEESIVLNEDTSKHVVQVLRMGPGELLHLTDGKGTLLTCTIKDQNKKSCEVKIENATFTPPKTKKVAIGISLLKSSDRFEWFLEKATEIGVSEIIPMLCERTEREKFRHDRLAAVVTSAMLQSQQTWLPLLHPVTKYDKVIAAATATTKLIAHCGKGEKKLISSHLSADALLLIGPEGDFSDKEIVSAGAQQFVSVSLGTTRLRTETAGVVAAALLLQ